MRSRLLLPFALPLIMAVIPAARAEVVSKADTGFVVRSSGLTGKSPREAWAVLTTPSGWWDKEHTWSGDSANLTLDPRAGGCFCETLALPDGAPASARRGSVEHMRIIFADPGKVLRMSGGLGPLQSEALVATLTITLKPVGGGTRILWEYVTAGYMRFKPEEIAPSVDAMIADQVARLVVKIDAAPVKAAALGKAPGLVRRVEPRVAALPEAEPAPAETPTPAPTVRRIKPRVVPKP